MTTTLRHTLPAAILKVAATLSVALCLAVIVASCEDERMLPPEKQPAATQTATYANIAGHWQLATFNGHQLNEGTHVYITFERRDHNFQIYDNLNSMYWQKRTGTYSLTDDEKTSATILAGCYDHNEGAMHNEYTITTLSETELQLTATGEPYETDVYHRIDAIPEHVLKATDR